MKKIGFIICMIFICMSLLCGCSDESTYDDVNKSIVEQLADDSISASGFVSAERYLNWCNQVKWVAVPIVIVSILFGIGMMYVFKHVKRLWKIGLFVFVIGIPIIIFVAVYAMCFLYGKFF